MPSPTALAAGREPDETWEDEIRAFEEGDQRRPPPRDAVVFVGSSSIRLWTSLARDMAPLVVVNRGFGGAQMDAIAWYAPRIVFPCCPRAVVVCAGENDLEPHRGKRPETVLDDLRRFDRDLAASLPSARLYLPSLKLSPARRESWAAVRRYNDLLARYGDEDPRRVFVDLTAGGLDAEGRPRPEFFLADGLHLSRAGYRWWTAVLKPVLLARESVPGSMDSAAGQERSTE